MKIEHKSITIREIVNNYFDDAENGVRGYNNLLKNQMAIYKSLVTFLGLPISKTKDVMKNLIYIKSTHLRTTLNMITMMLSK